ncbi:MAG: hypothetical protein HRU72_14590 [Planctomycetia bacterium]|nr:hypothetical protein [Candidatus Brocadia sp.]QOJ07678.1 MAG: hypothetical protein HRU72_14590 [Planctomycetia bacterium]HQU31786.1 hypothetical protein [Candidatus Brocadia sapporoensis]
MGEGSAQKLEKARRFNKNSGNYTRITVLFTLILFFCGVSTQFETIRYRITMIVTGGVALCISLELLATYPVALELTLL